MDISAVRLAIAVVGALLVALGAGMWWLPAGPIAGGALLLLAALVGELCGGQANRPAEGSRGDPGGA